MTAWFDYKLGLHILESDSLSVPLNLRLAVVSLLENDVTHLIGLQKAVKYTRFAVSDKKEQTKLILLYKGILYLLRNKGV